MKNKLFLSIGMTLLSSMHWTISHASTCSNPTNPTGFTQVKNEKSYFYAEPIENKKNKSYLVARDFVQVIGKPEGTYSCVVYRNYNGYGGKQTLGWMLTDSLEPIRTKLERKDLIASWNKSPCSDESCVIDIAEEKGKLQINLYSYINDRPSETYEVGTIKESDGHLVLSNLKGSSGGQKNMEIEYKKITETGTILVTGPEGWAGIYHR